MIEVAFWASVMFLAYTYAGYPAIILALSRLCPRPAMCGDFTPPVTIIIIAYNEEQTIVRKLESCLGQQYPAGNLEIIVVSDGSRDLTRNKVSQFKDRGVRYLEHEERRGKAACINDAVQACRTDYIIFSDARQRLAPDAVMLLMRNFVDPSVGGVSGELVFEGVGGNEFSKSVDVYWRYEKFLRQSEGRLDSVVGATGALYAISRAYFEPIPSGTILDDVLIPMNIVLQGKRIVFEPAAIVFDVPSPNVASEQRRKRRTLAGNYQIVALKPSLLNPLKNRLWVQYVSHKITRLLAPLAMLVAFVTNALLVGSAPWYALLMALQLLLYGMAFLGIFYPVFMKLAIFRIPTTFCTYNWCAVLGFAEFIKNRNPHLWR